ncbi:hypothetical protein Cgig2_020440 [Carnegiea gigantea]|uniref:At4g14310 8-bladed propeller domain-containing protein n=1 Tax=Carnegiea gigantea TaxID=171969 RepID=A0A9Q1JYU4_9CARY|nr:hypothetical protein Cgig2_020440 [Carnegiea gigantea]
MCIQARSKSPPRCRSPSPSDFTRILSDLCKTRVPSDRGLVGSTGWGLNGSRVLEKKGFRDLGHKVNDQGLNGFRVYTDEKENGIAGENYKNSGKKIMDEESAVSKLLSDHKGENANQNAILKPDHVLFMRLNAARQSFKQSGLRNWIKFKELNDERLDDFDERENKPAMIAEEEVADGCSGKYVVAVSAGNTMDSGLCSWDFYSNEGRAFHTEDNGITSSVAVGSLPDNNRLLRRNALADITPSENRRWWNRPCGPLMISTASYQRTVNNPQALSSVSTSVCRISAVHVNNTDAELGGALHQRVSSSEAEGNDGVFYAADSINVLNFRHPLGIGLKIPKIGVTVEYVSSRGDSVFLSYSCVIVLVQQ